jgi:glycosyltransferase involved in cell wall biosynthesis
MKVLWFCGVEFSDLITKPAETWVQAMASSLVRNENFELYNITLGSTKEVTRKDCKLVKQWLIPSVSLEKNGLPHIKTIRSIQSIVEDIKPDIIHIWGIEGYWGLLTARGYIKGNVILEIQGFKFICAKYLFSGLTFLDVLKCFGLKEFLKPSISLVGQKYAFIKREKFEKEILKNNMVISTQSEWVRSLVTEINPKAQIFCTSIALRSEFIDSHKWDVANCEKYQVFTSTSYLNSYKGLHILIDAIATLKNRYPQISLHIAALNVSGIRESGYSKWLKKRIKTLKIDNNIYWLGPLDAKNLVKEIHKANVVVVPSFVETYSLAFEEALTLGAPTVASFAGAMPELANHKKTALFFSPGDVLMCAKSIEIIFNNQEFTKKISRNSYNEKMLNSNSDVAQSQLEIYKKLIAK